MRRVGSIAIVGGGSSGWMAAAHFGRLFPDLTVSVIESDTIPVIGVGEATVPLLTLFMDRLGFPDPQAWMKLCDATYKTGILFEDWRAQGEAYWHPFEYLDYVDVGIHAGHCWLNWHRAGDPAFRTRQSFAEAFFPSFRLNALGNRAPAFREVAYHIDAGLLGEFLRDAAPGVERVVGTVQVVERGAAGDLEALVLDGGRRVAADLFLDCTGFRRVLMRAAAPENRFDSYAQSLFCDRAVVIRMEHPEGAAKEAALHPYVRAAARSAGWIWSIPLYGRMSSGYVYSSAFLSEEEAERELRAYWRLGDRDVGPVHRVRFETGKLDRSWAGNCIAIGLAGGFIEPLESTGLAITQTGIELAGSMLDARVYDARTVARYNAHMTKFYEDILHFIIVHYCLTRRRDSAFWRAVAESTHVPEALAARLEVFRRLLPTGATRGTNEVFMFRDISWFAVLLGMGFDFEAAPVPDKLQTAARMIRARKAEQLAEQERRLPNHYRYLRENVFGRP